MVSAMFLKQKLYVIQGLVFMSGAKIQPMRQQQNHRKNRVIVKLLLYRLLEMFI